jgi:hypothetical protein
VTDGIFYFSNKSASATVVLTHPHSPQRVKRQEFHFLMTLPFFSDFSVADIIFYFSNISTLAYIVKTHPIHSRG